MKDRVKSSEIKAVTPERVNKSLNIVLPVFKDWGIFGDCQEAFGKDV